MAEIYRDLLLTTCLGLLGWGVIRLDRVYQYPFIMGSIFISFLVPQAFAIVNNPGLGVTQTALERVLLYSCFCAIACLAGYRIKPNKNWLSKLNLPIDENKLFRAGIALMLQGWFFNILLARTAVQTVATGGWTGPGTIFLFFTQVTNIAFGIFLLQFLKRPNNITLIFAIISGWPLLSSALLGRRQPVMTLVIIVGLCLFLAKRYLPPRWLVITAIITMSLLIPLFGVLREGFWDLIFNGDWQELSSLSQYAFSSLLEGDLLELRSAALLMDASERLGLNGYGTGWWDAIVFQFVPGQIVGYELKKSLQFNLWGQYLDSLKYFYNYTIPNGYTITGIGDSFLEFSYFGCLSFALISYLMRHLWISAVHQKNASSQILYMGLVSPAMVGLTHGVGRFWQETLFQLIFVGLVTFYAKTRHPARIKSNSLEDA
jgi:hypothetical protein